MDVKPGLSRTSKGTIWKLKGNVDLEKNEQKMS